MTEKPQQQETLVVAPVVVEITAHTSKVAAMHIIAVAIGVTGLLYFAQSVALPVFLAIFMGLTLKPVIGWLSLAHIPKALSSAIVLCLLVTAIGIGFSQLGRPALVWLDEAPQHLTELRQRVQTLFPGIASFNETAAAFGNLGATKAEQQAARKQSPSVQLQDHSGTSSILNWTGTLLMGIGETLVLLYLLLASGDQFTRKLVNMMPTLSDKKRAVEITREIQHNIAHYLISVTLINIGLGISVGFGFYALGVPNAAMWGMAVVILNYIPYLGPVIGITLMLVVGLLTFDSLVEAISPPLWYFLLNLLESNIITPILLGRRFSLNPVVVFISLIFWTWLWGVPGALLSVPILVSIKVVCDHIPGLTGVSELLKA